LSIYKEGLSAGFGSWRKVDSDNSGYERHHQLYACNGTTRAFAGVSNNHTDERLMDG